MRRFTYLLFLFLLSASATGEDTYQTPMPHSTAAQILSYCEAGADVISQLRCNYYLQGVADLAVQAPQACLPRGMNQSELIEVAVTHLKSVDQSKLENNSGAAVLMPYLQRSYRCPKTAVAGASNASKTGKQRFAEAIGKALAAEKAAESSGADSSASGAKRDADESIGEEL